MRSVSASRGLLHAREVDQHELAAVAVALADDPADRAPRGLRLVGDDRDLRADERVHERRLADVRPAGDRDEARARHQLRRAASDDPACSASISPSSVSWSKPASAARRGRSPREVVGVLGADHDVAELARAGAGLGAVDREREHVRGASMPRCARFSSRIALGRRRARPRDGRRPQAAAASAASAAGRSVAAGTRARSESALAPARSDRPGAQVPRLALRVTSSRRSRCAGRACAARRPRR